MKSKVFFLMVFVVFSIFLRPGTLSAESEYAIKLDPVKDLKSGWSQEPIYEHSLIYPAPFVWTETEICSFMTVRSRK